MNPKPDLARRPSRRRLLVMAGGAAVALAAARMLAGPAQAAPAEARRLLERLTQGKAKAGRIRLGVAEIVENGNLVPVTLSVDSPMTAGDHVRRLHLVAERNPQALAASFTFTPLGGKAEVQVRIRLLDSQTVFAVAEMSDGSLWIAEKSVQVTVGGCTGSG
ncbi:MAG: hypothetical protein KIT81_03145 [Alphaproteobacteria bacterium]|nr:hypothetical protein [Alphaproteobacteria bacterium]